VAQRVDDREHALCGAYQNIHDESQLHS
jgi:hypothetical protein